MNKLLWLGFHRLGYDYEYVKKIHTPLYGGKFLFQDEDRTVLGLKRLHDAQEEVVVFPDFDIDGISAGCVLYAGLSLLGFQVRLFAPNTGAGYGIRFDDIDRLAASYPDAKAIITCDVGAGAYDEAAYAQSKELWFYVTDHHIEKDSTRKRTMDAMVDPSRRDSDLEFRGVCGAWVAWHVLSVYAKLAGTELELALVRKLLLFVGLGSCGDMMPMVHDTRLAVQASLKEFNKLLECDSMAEYFGTDPEALPEAYAAPFENLRALHMRLLSEGHMREGDVTDETYSFSYCPLFNSIKRMHGDIGLLYELLYTRHPWNSQRRLELIDWLEGLNADRKAMVGRLYGQLYGNRAQALAPYVYLVDANPGILGLLANKIMERTGKPCLVLRPDPGKEGWSGSGRTPAWFDRSGVSCLPGTTIDGHDHSFGVFVAEDALQGMRDALDQACREQAAAASQGTAPVPAVTVVLNGHACYGADYDFSVNGVNDYDICMGCAMEAQNYRPYGEGFREPEFLLKFTRRDVGSCRTMGADGTHLRLSLDHNINAVWFGGAPFFKKLEACQDDDRVFCLRGSFGVNYYRGAASLQFLVSGEE